MKVLVVPDVHGSREWEIVKTFPQDSYDRIVFMGDYFDAWENKWPEQGENFEAICAFVRQDPERRKALLGNHDWSYLSATVYGAGCSGHQNGKASKIKSLLISARDILDLAFEADGVVFQRLKSPMYWDRGLFFSKTRELTQTDRQIIALAKARRAEF